MNILYQAFDGTDDRNLDAIVGFIGSAWELSDVNGRRELLARLGSVRGFRTVPSLPWLRIAPAFKVALNGWDDARIAILLRECFLQGLLHIVTQFHAALHPESRQAALQGVLPPPDSPVHQTSTWCPSAEDFLAVHAQLSQAQRLLFIRFCAVIAQCGIVAWRPSARAAALQILGRSDRIDEEISASRSAPDDKPESDSPAKCSQHEDASRVQPEVLPATPSVILEESDTAVGNRNPEQLEAIDRLVIDAAVASVNAQHGALPMVEVEKLAQDFALLNLKRSVSFFHWGFVLALGQRSLPAHGSRFNPARRAWLLAGWLLGHARTSKPVALQQWRSMSADDRSALISHRPAALHAAGPMIEILISTDDADELVTWLPHVGRDHVDLVIALSSYGRTLQHQGRWADLARVTSAAAVGLGSWVPGILMELHAHMVAALRRASRFGDAEATAARLQAGLRSVIDSVDGEDMVARDLSMHLLREGLAHALLAKVRISQVGGKWFSRRCQPSDLVFEFSSSLPEWLRALGEANGDEHPLIELTYMTALVVCSAEDGTTSMDDLEQVAEALRLALLEANRTDAPMWAGELLPRLRLLHALVSFHVDRSAYTRCLDAVNAIMEFERNHEELPTSFLMPVLEAAVILEVHSVADCLAARVERNPSELIDSGLLEASLKYESVRGALLVRLKEIIRAVSNRQALVLRMSLFASLVDAGVRDDSVKDLADDLMSMVSKGAAEASLVIGLLSQRDRWESVWDSQEEFAGALAVLARGSTDPTVRSDAVTRIYAAARHVIHEPGGLSLCEDYCDALEMLGADSTWIVDLQSIVSRAKAQTKQQASTSALERRECVRVLFVGGDERQAQGEDKIRRLLRDSAPEAEPTFEYPGWSANWGNDLPRLDSLIMQSDVVVTMRFMRTLYGGHLRRMCNEHKRPWRATVGHGPVAIARAMASAVDAVR